MPREGPRADLEGRSAPTMTSDPSEDGRDLRRAILDQARSLLLESGHTGLTMRRIAGAIGCTPTAIYLYFRDKDALLHALIDEGLERLHGALQETARETPDPVERVEALCRRYVAFGLENPEYYEVMFTLRPRRMERYPAEKYRRGRRSLEVFAESLAEAHARGRMEAPDPLLAASVVWSGLHGAVELLSARRLDQSIDRSAFVEAAVHHACRGVTAPADADPQPGPAARAGASAQTTTLAREEP